MGKEEENHLKDMVFRGAFLVILVYVLVFLYNSGLLDKLRRPNPKSSPTPSVVNENVNESQPKNQPSEDRYLLLESTSSAEEQVGQ